MNTAGMALSLSAAAALVGVAAASLLSRNSSSRLPLACAALSLAGIEVAGQLDRESATGFFLRAGLVLEAALPASLLWYGVSFSRAEPVRLRSARGAIVLAAAVLFSSAALFLSLDEFVYYSHYQAQRLLVFGSAGYWLSIGIMLSCITTLVHIETVFASSSAGDREKIKFQVIGMAAVLAVLIFQSSQGLMYGSFDENLQPVRSGVFVIAAGMILASKLRGNGARIAVSRTVFFRSATVLGVGAYLLAIGLAGKALTYFDVPFDRSIVLSLGFAGAVMLVVALVSERIRRRVKVFISKHFFAQKHDYRETWLDLTARLSSCTTSPELEKAIIAVYRDIFGLGEASLYRLERSGKYACTGNDAVPVFAPSEALLAYFRDKNRVWNPADGEYLPSAAELRFIQASRARLVVPLMLNREAEGFLAFGSQAGADAFNYEDYDLMKIIARQSALLLSNLRLSGELIETGELAAVARVSSFVVHDLKNLTYALSLTIENAEEHIGDHDFQQDLMMTIRRTVGNMKSLVQKLKLRPDKSGAGTEPHDLNTLAASVVREFLKNSPDASIVCRGGPVCCAADAGELRKVIVNLVQNGIEAVGKDGTVTVETGMIDGSAVLRVSDAGCGIPPEFMQRELFRPFRSTKKGGLGIGLYHCKQIVETLGGTITAKSESGRGSTFTVTLPAARAVRSPGSVYRPNDNGGTRFPPLKSGIQSSA